MILFEMLGKGLGQFEMLERGLLELCEPRNNYITFDRRIFFFFFDESFFADGRVVKSLDSQSRGPVFKTAGWLQGRLSLSSFRGR